MLSWFQVSRARRAVQFVPGRGVCVVFQRQMRARCPFRDLIWMAVLVLCHAALSLGLQSMVMPAREYASNPPHFLLRWLSMAALVGPLLYLPIAAALGAFAAPPISRFEETQSMLLTRLTPFDVCAGRLFASLWPLITAILAVCALALSAQLIWRPLPRGSTDGYIAILLMHMVLLCAAFAIGAIGFLFAIRRRPGRTLARGTCVAVAGAVLSMSILFLANSMIRRLDNPTSLIYGALLVNPATAATTALHLDILRMPWLYERTDAPEYPFTYPSPLASCALFATAGGVALAVSSVRLRRAYQ